MSIDLVGAIKQFEGFSPAAKWDYAQFTNGFGTRAKFAGETIGMKEAEARLLQEINQAAKLVENFAPGLSEGAKHALTSLTFNAGPGWMKDGLGQAVQQGDLDKARSIFLQYNKADGEVLPGLVKRRLVEATWFGKELHADETPAVSQQVSQSTASPPSVDAPRSAARVSIPPGVELHTSDRVSNQVAEWIVWSHIESPDLLKAENKDKADRA